MFTGSFRRASNRADWRWTAKLTDPSTGAAINLAGATIAIAIREPESKTARVTGSTTDGRVTITGAATGDFSVVIPRVAMATLVAQHYDVGMTVRLASGVVEQIAIATLPVLDGIVAA